MFHEPRRGPLDAAGTGAAICFMSLLLAHPPCGWLVASGVRLEPAISPLVLAGRCDAYLCLLRRLQHADIHTLHTVGLPVVADQSLSKSRPGVSLGGISGGDTSGSGLRSCMHSMGHPLRSPSLLPIFTRHEDLLMVGSTLFYGSVLINIIAGLQNPSSQI